MAKNDLMESIHNLVNEHGTLTRATRVRRGFHTLSFDDTIVSVGGKKFTLAKGFDEIENLCETKSPTEIAQWFAMFAYCVNHKLPIPKPKAKEEPTEEAPTETA